MFAGTFMIFNLCNWPFSSRVYAIKKWGGTLNAMEGKPAGRKGAWQELTPTPMPHYFISNWSLNQMKWLLTCRHGDISHVFTSIINITAVSALLCFGNYLFISIRAEEVLYSFQRFVRSPAKTDEEGGEGQLLRAFSKVRFTTTFRRINGKSAFGAILISNCFYWSRIHHSIQGNGLTQVEQMMTRT